MPTTVAIPPWDAEGLLPPADMANPVSANRAPYLVTLADVVMRFNTSAERATILTGFLDYRAALHAAGLTTGFQWLDGSFMEHIEVSARRRPPNDIDVVTFYQLPAGHTQATLVAGFPALFDHDVVKTRYRVDAYLQSLSTSGERLVNRGAYWYGVWAHQRDTFKWKGFLQIDLAPGSDAATHALLASSSTVTTVVPASTPASPAASTPQTTGVRP